MTEKENMPPQTAEEKEMAEATGNLRIFLSAGNYSAAEAKEAYFRLCGVSEIKNPESPRTV